ncbi:AraC family transcriptional regulator [Amycolatopsis pigmentata]|uniref:Helix-turn-helix domain-containing protein n=1 Tax=Amycolatopsis pigmentata TaxID=450801 RepID=A0ABW5FSY3_9PSEU
MDPGESAESVPWRPAPALRGLVASYHGYRRRGGPPVPHRGLPSPYLTMIVTFDDPLVIAEHPDPRQRGGRYRTLVGGLHTRPATITRTAHEAGIQLALHPLGVRTLLGLPAGELARVDVGADEVFGAVAHELYERVGTATSWPERFAVIDDVLMRVARQGETAAPELRHVWHRLIGTAGSARVRDLAREAGWSERHLANRFRAEIGLSPKEALRVVRFDLARRSLQRQAANGDQPLLADLAAACGYYDQAHLAREFRDLAGCPPSRWLAEEFGNVQVTAPPEPAAWLTRHPGK